MTTISEQAPLPTRGHKENSTMTMNMEENCSDTTPGITVANEEIDEMNRKTLFGCGGRRGGSRRANTGSISFWMLAVITVMIVAGGTLTAVIMMSNRDRNGNSSSIGAATENDGPPKQQQQSESYYKERFEIFRSVAGRISATTALVQSGSPPSKALDWMVYHDTTIPHEALLSKSGDDTSSSTSFIQRYIIMVLFYACGGEQWQGFVSSTIELHGHIDTCLWIGDDFIACNDFNEVVELKLDFRRLGGQLPLEMRALTTLETLDMSYNFLEGSLPNNLFDVMTNLKNLFLNNNEFIGNFPTSIGMATGLRNIDVGFNYFTGSLPVEFGTLTTLQRFSAKDNSLTGSFFEPFGAAWTNLEHLNLDGTQFTGTIPSSVIATWANSLVDMELGLNMFNGTLPTEIGTLTKLTGLNINGPKLRGPIPDVSELKNLQFLSIEGTKITGTIPNAIGLLGQLQEIVFRFTGITGTIPTEIGMCTNLGKLVFTGNLGLTGTIPSEIKNFENFKTLTVVENTSLEGPIPTSICSEISSASVTVIRSCDIECTCCIDMCIV